MSSSTLTPNSKICRYYIRGTCRFGDLCRFSHAVPQIDTSNLAENSGAELEKSVNITNSRSWVNAPIFIPKGYLKSSTSVEESLSSAHQTRVHRSWAEVAGGSCGDEKTKTEGNHAITLCPYEYQCPYGEYCTYQHGELCDMCGMYCLHPTDKVVRRKHINECIQQHEKDMELSFAIARSKDKTCGICFDIIMEKSGREKRFGILPNCSHIFCLECIRKWRQAKQFDNKITRSCPECRIASDFVCPSAFWVESKDDKDKLLKDYRSALRDKDCKYFNKGEGKCPFGNKCFYKHALPNGSHVDVGCPQRSRKLHGNSDELIDLLDIYLWEFVDQRDFNWLEFLSNETDSDDSDWSVD